MKGVFTVVHIGLYLVVTLEALAICVLFYRNTELLKLAMRSDRSSDLIGMMSPAFEALNVRTANVVRSNDIIYKRTYILFLSSNCGVCQKLLEEVRKLGYDVFDKLGSSKLVIYCEGSRRGCARFLSDLDPKILTLSGHKQDVAVLFSVRTPPVLVEIDYTTRTIVNYAYPFSVDDLLVSLNRSPDSRSGMQD